jgi:hypothetical protein
MERVAYSICIVTSFFSPYLINQARATSPAQDLYTQTEAHLQLKTVRNLIQKTYAIIPYLDIIAAIVAKEGEYKHTHYVFYHGQANEWRVPQDLYRKLYLRLNQDPAKHVPDNFHFLRFTQTSPAPQTPAAFILKESMDHGLIDDTDPRAKAALISANLALFGNVGYTAECSWQYFLTPSNYTSPTNKVFENILQGFKVNTNYAQEISNLAKNLTNGSQTILQIFIPRAIVDQVAYPSFIRGMPADSATIDWVFRTLPTQQREKKTLRDVVQQLETIKKQFSKDKKNTNFQAMLRKAELGNFSVQKLLAIYRNTPHKLQHINYLQARLLLTSSHFADPSSGIYMFRYSTLPPAKLQEYESKLDSIVTRIMREHTK